MFKAAVLTLSSIVDRELPTGETINDRYEVIKFLGKGSYGYSYLVHDSLNGRQVVLKMLRFHKRIFKSGKKLFEKEITFLKRFNCLSFPKFFEYGHYRKTPFFTMEYINGKTFEQLIFQEGKRYSESEAFIKGLELLQLVEQLHKEGIIHRDIRIPNIMIDEKGMKVIDFGLAKYLEEQETASLLKIRNIRRDVSPLNDYYSIGHFLLFLLYSRFEVPENSTKRSWEEELQISDYSKFVIKKLLLTEAPYESIDEIRGDFLKILNINRGKLDVIL